jgi:hypothetical protein
MTGDLQDVPGAPSALAMPSVMPDYNKNLPAQLTARPNSPCEEAAA